MECEELIATVRTLLRDTIEVRYRGELHVSKVRSQAYADGYLRALADAGLVGHEQLLQIVAEERQRAAEAADAPLAAAG